MPSLAAVPAVPAVEAVGLRKEYGDTVAVSDLSLSVRRGEVFGFLGPNGAGKTTTVKMLLGLAAPTGGQARVLGRRPGDPEAMARIGFLPEHFRFPGWLTAEGLLDAHGRMHGMSRERRRQRTAAVLERVGLADRASSRLGTFSKGMNQRIGLAQALLAEPEVVFLDEPTSALDPIGRREVREIIRDLRAADVTVFLNSHLLGEVELTCNRVAIVKAGRVVDAGPLDALAGGSVEVDVRADGVTDDLMAGLARKGAVARRDGRRLTVVVDGEDALPGLVDALVAGGARVYAVTPRRMSLEEMFVRAVDESP